MLTALLIALTLGQAPSTPEILLSADKDARLLVTVRPRDERRIASVRVEPQPSKRAGATRTPISRVVLPKALGERFTFRPTAKPFDIIVTFTDKSTYRLEQKATFNVEPILIAR